MKKAISYLVFAGTSEGRQLAEFFQKNQIPALFCVATAYGEELLEQTEEIRVHTGRMDEIQMQACILELMKTGLQAVIDATHPHAVDVTENLKRACEAAGARYIRLLRKPLDLSAYDHIVTVKSCQEAADWLEAQQGNIFLTTGLKELPEIAAQITDKTKIVAMTQVSNVLGRENPIRAVADLAHAKGAVMVVDGAQSTPHKAVDVQALGADFLAFSGHKIFGPMGIGALYGRKELLKKMPPFLSGGEMIESVTREGAVFAELPHKFEAGTVNAAGAVGLHAAINYLQKIGYEEMERRETALVARALAGMKEMPYVHVLGSELPEEHTGIVAFAVDGVHPHDISEILAADDIAVRAGHHCAQPLLKHLGYNSTVRASFAFYNTEEEVDRLLASVSTLRERMGYGK